MSSCQKFEKRVKIVEVEVEEEEVEDKEGLPASDSGEVVITVSSPSPTEFLLPDIMTSSSSQRGESSLANLSEEYILGANWMTLGELYAATGHPDDPCLEDTEDLRQRLILIRRNQLGTSHTWKHQFTNMLTNNDAKVQPLSDICEQVHQTMSTIDVQPLSDILQEEGYLDQNDLLEELSSRQEELLKKDTKIVVLGETNGGKSSLLNLLLGLEILPTAFTHCTVTVCKIKYAETYSVEIIAADSSRTFHPCDSQEQAQDVLKSVVTENDMRNRGTGSEAKEVTIYMPAEILKSGVTLVDTPGIGESAELDEVTLNYVRSTKASGFIYIIKTDSAGGVQEDRLMSFLSAIREQYSTSLQHAFNPSAAMFVCHRWDAIQPENRDKVKANAYKKLASVWPGFENSQTFFFSTKDTQKHLRVDPSYVTDSFNTLLTGLKDLFHLAISNAIEHQYTWLKNIIHPMSRHLRTMITYCINTNEELENSFREVADKQEKLKSDSETHVVKLKEELDSSMKKLREGIFSFLEIQTEEVRSCLFDYDELLSECSADKFLVDKGNRVNLDEKLIDSLLQYVDKEVKNKKLIENVERDITEAIETHLGLFKTQVVQIKRDLKGGLREKRNSLTSLSSLSGSRNSQSSFDGQDGLGDSGPRRDSDMSLRSGEFSGSRTSFSSTASSGDLNQNLEAFSANPAQLASHVKRILLSRKRMHRASTQRQTRREMRQTVLGKIKDRIKHGNDDPEKYIKERCVKVAKDIKNDDDIIDEIVAGYAEWIAKCVEYAAACVPKFTAVNDQLMLQIRNHRKDLSDDKDKLKKAMERLEPCRNRLKGYGSLYMADVQAELLNFSLERRESSIDTPSNLSVSARQNDSGFIDSGSYKRKIRSLWARLQAATITVNNQPNIVVVKSYLYEMEEQNLLDEISALRCLENKHVAHFFGMTRLKMSADRSQDSETAERVSGFIFRGELTSVHVYNKRRSVNQREWLPGMFHSLLKGLDFIHREKLVHMELNVNTVTVDSSTGEVKLCHICLPRKARMPEDLDVMTKSCACLSPEVLRGDVYQQADDMYAFGLFLWELLFPLSPEPFAEERKWPLREFIEKCSPATMLKAALKELNASDSIHHVLEGTLLADMGEIKRLTAYNIGSILSSLKDDQAVLSLRSRKSEQHQRRRRCSDAPIPVVHEELSPYVKDLSKTIPVRPPRKKDLLKSHLNVPGSNLTSGQHSSRRVSCPNLGPSIESFRVRGSSPSKDENKIRSFLKNLFRKSGGKSGFDSDPEVKGRKGEFLIQKGKKKTRRASHAVPPTYSEEEKVLPLRRRSGVVNITLTSSESISGLEQSPSLKQRQGSPSASNRSSIEDIKQQASEILEKELSASLNSRSSNGSPVMHRVRSNPDYHRMKLKDTCHREKSWPKYGHSPLYQEILSMKRSPKLYRAPSPPDTVSETSSIQSLSNPGASVSSIDSMTNHSLRAGIFARPYGDSSDNDSDNSPRGSFSKQKEISTAYRTSVTSSLNNSFNLDILSSSCQSQSEGYDSGINTPGVSGMSAMFRISPRHEDSEQLANKKVEVAHRQSLQNKTDKTRGSTFEPADASQLGCLEYTSYSQKSEESACQGIDLSHDDRLQVVPEAIDSSENKELLERQLSAEFHHGEGDNSLQRKANDHPDGVDGRDKRQLENQMSSGSVKSDWGGDDLIHSGALLSGQSVRSDCGTPPPLDLSAFGDIEEGGDDSIDAGIVMGNSSYA